MSDNVFIELTEQGQTLMGVLTLSQRSTCVRNTTFSVSLCGLVAVGIYTVSVVVVRTDCYMHSICPTGRYVFCRTIYSCSTKNDRRITTELSNSRNIILRNLLI